MNAVYAHHLAYHPQRADGWDGSEQGLAESLTLEHPVNMADCSRPQPVDPLWDCKQHFLRTTCKCQRKMILSLDDVVRLYPVPQVHHRRR